MAGLTFGFGEGRLSLAEDAFNVAANDTGDDWHCWRRICGGSGALVVSCSKWTRDTSFPYTDMALADLFAAQNPGALPHP
jgi:hypothetical protein